MPDTLKAPELKDSGTKGLFLQDDPNVNVFTETRDLVPSCGRRVGTGGLGVAWSPSSVVVPVAFLSHRAPNTDTERAFFSLSLALSVSLSRYIQKPVIVLVTEDAVNSG